MATKTAHAVGKGKPPKHSQFKKGQSGNPSGKPGPEKSARAALKQEILTALHSDFRDFEHLGNEWAYRPTVMGEMARSIALKAARGDQASIKMLLALLEQYETRDSENPNGERTLSLPQGKTQGKNGEAGPGEQESEKEQAVAAETGPAAGKEAGNDDSNPHSHPHDRGMIQVAGRWVYPNR